MEHDVWAEIDLKAIRHNVDIVKQQLLPDTGILAVVKANGYGHGMVEVAKSLTDSDAIDMFAVTSIEEAITLHQSGITKPILNIGYTAAKDVKEAIARGISVTVYDRDCAVMLHEVAEELRKPLRIHIKLDTGMSRLGILPDAAIKLVPEISRMPYFRVQGIFSHFADESDNQFVQQQYDTMQSILFDLQKSGYTLPAVHMAKSAVLFQSKEYHFDAVRPGLALYGYGPDGHDLQPAMSLKTVLAQIKRIPKGSKVGYMQTYVAPREMLIGVIPIGYSHGYDRGLSNKGHVLVDDWQCPVIGRVCMSQTIIDLSAVRSTSKLAIGQEVVAFGKQKRQEITVDQVAKWIDTNRYEVVARVAESVHRTYSVV